MFVLIADLFDFFLNLIEWGSFDKHVPVSILQKTRPSFLNLGLIELELCLYLLRAQARS